MFSYEIITERKEPEQFLDLFGDRETYEIDYRPVVKCISITYNNVLLLVIYTCACSC